MPPVALYVGKPIEEQFSVLTGWVWHRGDRRPWSFRQEGYGLELLEQSNDATRFRVTSRMASYEIVIGGDLIGGVPW